MPELLATKPSAFSETLRNSYFLLRHGTSVANERRIIVSDPRRGISAYGLTKRGEAEVSRSIEAAKASSLLDSSTIIVSSDFERARDSAKIAARVLCVPKILYSPKLRERFFGEFEGKSNQHYRRVWYADARDPTHKRWGVESVMEVVRRFRAQVREVEERFSNRSVLFVSHGDTLQIGRTLFEDLRPSMHRSLPHLATGEVRALG